MKRGRPLVIVAAILAAYLVLAILVGLVIWQIARQGLD
jgi:cytochrome oxidase assembly protein ShyY1